MHCDIGAKKLSGKHGYAFPCFNTMECVHFAVYSELKKKKCGRNRKRHKMGQLINYRGATYSDNRDNLL